MRKSPLLLVTPLLFLFAINTYSQAIASINAEHSSYVKEKVEVESDVLKVEKKSKLNLFGDVRLRAEQDWDSRNFNGSFREDRFRLRYRLRLGFTYDWSDHVSFGARLRTGVDESLQSPHNNFGHREFTGVPVNFDKIFISGKYDKYWWWAGKNSFPFWKQNEIFWDDDVTPEGLAIGANYKVNNIDVKPKLGYFITNTGNGNFDPRDPTNGNIDGHMIGAQMELGVWFGDHKLTFASSYLALRDINNVPTTDFFFSGERFKLDYTFIVSGFKLDLNTRTPITFGFDHFTNLEDYDDITTIDDVFKDQKNGFVISARVGKLSQKGDWLFGYYYARKEEYSVVSYYTEDDWVRFGNINRNRNTNYRGHEFRVAYAVDPNFNIVARAYFVDGLVTAREATESGKRFRIDFNMRFNKDVE